MFLKTQPQFPLSPSGRVSAERLSELIKQPLYAGYIHSESYGLSWLKAKHEPLISLETYQKIQNRRQGRAKAPKRANIGDDFALHGIVTCACCEAPLRSSFSEGRKGRRYPYYLCQTKSCVEYGKSIKRDLLEGEVGSIVKSLEPSHNLMILATNMFRHIWDARHDQAVQVVQSAKAQIISVDKDIDVLLERIVASSKFTVIQKYEDKISEHERDKAVLLEKQAHQIESKESCEEKLEPALAFLASPWKLWETGHITLRRMVLKLAFAGPIRYCRKSGARTIEISFPFRALAGVSGAEYGNGGASTA